MTPCHWFTHRDWFQYTQSHISVEAGLHIILSVDVYWDWGVVGDRLCVWGYHEM